MLLVCGYKTLSIQDNITLIITQSVENRRLIEDITSVFVDRAKAELKYAESLEKVAA
jgi:hypothetical protein